MYAGPDSSKEDAQAFNCVQRAHQNSLENFPQVGGKIAHSCWLYCHDGRACRLSCSAPVQYLAVLLLGGLSYPITASIAGAVYLIGRIAYFRVSECIGLLPLI